MYATVTSGHFLYHSKMLPISSHFSLCKLKASASSSWFSAAGQFARFALAYVQAPHGLPGQRRRPPWPTEDVAGARISSHYHPASAAGPQLLLDAPPPGFPNTRITFGKIYISWRLQRVKLPFNFDLFAVYTCS